jgi:hypothetical protein
VKRWFNKRQRQILLWIAGGKCQLCKKKLKKNFHADHIRPFSKGGKTITNNGQALCPECNTSKGNKNMNIKLRPWQSEALQKSQDWWFEKNVDRHFVINAAPVYLKGSDDVKDMLHYLKNEGNKLEENRVKDSYPEVFDIFSKGYLGSDVEQQLVDCLKNMKSRDYPTILNNLASLRRIQEEIIIKLNKPKLSLIPDQFMTTPTVARVDVKNAIGYLANNKNFILQGSIIQKFSDNTYDVISANGSHTPYAGPDADVSYKPTRHTVQSCVYAMLDILLWFKSIMEES